MSYDEYDNGDDFSTQDKYFCMYYMYTEKITL